MLKRVFSREFKLSLMDQIESGQKQVAQICQTDYLTDKLYDDLEQ
jgi:transposase-like protein